MTQLLVVLSLALTGVIVLVLVAYLLAIIHALWVAGNHLEKLAGGLTAVRDDTAPLAEDVAAINDALSALLDKLAGTDSNLSAIVEVARRGRSTD